MGSAIDGPTYWTTCTVTDCVPGETVAFGVGSSDKPLDGSTTRLAPNSDGTDVTESFALAPTMGLRAYSFVLGWARGKSNQRGMQATLDAIKAEVESVA